MIIQNGKFFDNYEKRLQLGSGACGSVYKVQNIMDKSWSAIKVIGCDLADKEDKKYAFREIQTHAKLPSHPNVVTFKDCWFEQVTEKHHNLMPEFLKRNIDLPPMVLFLKMEYCAGNSI